MPINQEDDIKVEQWKPTKAENDLVLKLNRRIEDLKTFRSAIKANPYDTSSKARSVEDLWNMCDFISLPHKYSHVELQSWMAANSRPMIYAKIDTALATLIEQNPEIEISGRKEEFDKKAAVLEALYSLSWDKGHGQQQLMKYVLNCAKYGFAVAREYHRFEEKTISEIIQYDPENFKHLTEDKKVVNHDEPYFEVLPIRDCWFDNRARPYDEDSVRDWMWEVSYDYSTFLQKFPFSKYPNAKYVSPLMGDTSQSTRDLAEYNGVISRPSVRLQFYENLEDDEFLITDGRVIVYRGQLLNHQLSCVWAY